MLPASYFCNIPEDEDLLEAERGCKTLLPSHICFASREQFSENTAAPNRTLEHTRRVIAGFDSSSETLKALDTPTKLSIHPLAPVSSDFPFAGVHSSVAVYSISRLEPMHVFSPGIGRLLK